MDQTPREQTAEAVRVELARRRLSGRALARAMGWTYSTTSRRLNAEYPFDIDQLVAVARFLGCPVVEFLPDSERAA